MNDKRPLKTDRRVRRTKQLLRETLLRLIVAQNDYASLSVQDIVAHADIARTTFYLHFSDKDELLFATMRDYYEDVFAGFKTASPILDHVLRNGEWHDFFDARQYANFYKVIFGDNGSPVFLWQLCVYLTKQVHKELAQLPPSNLRLKPELIAAQIAFAYVAALGWWVEQGKNNGPKEIYQVAYDQITRGVLWSVSLTPR
jgi:AcrR family transcriptional regulator